MISSRQMLSFDTQIASNIYIPGLEPPQVYRMTRPENRRIVEWFIGHCFYQQHRAQITTFAPELLVLTDKQQSLVAALGCQSAAAGPLFLEQYLDEPVEQVLQQRGIAQVTREQILEVGNLAAFSSGSTRRLILTLISYFYQQGYRWLVVTITPKVLNTFYKLGIELDLLAMATPDRLAPCQGDWGDYYHEQPMVYAGSFETALARMQQIPLLANLIAKGVTPYSDVDLALELP